MSASNETYEDVEQYVAENTELLARILAHGDAEARGYALAALANGGTVEKIERVQELLEGLKEDIAE